MQTFELVRPNGSVKGWRDGDAFIAGGTDLLQLMKNDVIAPRRLIDLTRSLPRDIAVTDGTLYRALWRPWPRWRRI